MLYNSAVCKTFKHSVLLTDNSQLEYLSLYWEYYRISNAMQYSDAALETTSLVMYDFKSFSYVLSLFLWVCEIYKHILYIINIINIISKMK